MLRLLLISIIYAHNGYEHFFGEKHEFLGERDPVQRQNKDAFTPSNDLHPNRNENT